MVQSNDCASRITVADQGGAAPSVIVYGEKIHRKGMPFVCSPCEEKKVPQEKCLEDVPIIRDFPEVFPNDLPGLPPPRQVEFRIELVPGAASMSHRGERSPSRHELIALVGDPSKEVHEEHLKELFWVGSKKKEKLYAKFQRILKDYTEAMKEDNVKAENLGRFLKPIFEIRSIIERISPVAYKLELPEKKKLSWVHNMFMFHLKKGVFGADENLIIPLEEIQFDDKLHFIEEPVEIMDREVKRIKQRRIPIVKVCWNSR
ncbi:hypothetical protein Tco_0573601 [Tanacetum coccineum]